METQLKTKIITNLSESARFFDTSSLSDFAELAKMRLSRNLLKISSKENLNSYFFHILYNRKYVFIRYYLLYMKEQWILT